MNFNFDDKFTLELEQNEKKGPRPIFRVQFPDGFVKRISEGEILVQLQSTFDPTLSAQPLTKALSENRSD